MTLEFLVNAVARWEKECKTDPMSREVEEVVVVPLELLLLGLDSESSASFTSLFNSSNSPLRFLLANSTGISKCPGSIAILNVVTILSAILALTVRSESRRLEFGPKIEAKPELPLPLSLSSPGFNFT